MKILITTSKHIGSYQLASFFKHHHVLFGDYFTDYPTDPSNSTAHQILKFCLDHQIQKVFPLAFSEVEELRKSLILFEEFGIEVMLSADEIQTYNYPDKQVNSFSELSAGLVSLGYPTNKIAIADAKGRGELLLIDDTVTHNSQIWNRISTLNFMQVGKWFNQANFSSTLLFKLDNAKLLQIFVLIDERGLSSVYNLSPPVLQAINDSAFLKKGFYHLAFADLKLIRIVNATL
ncbi:MAG TPA: hypothetical protein VF273_04800 [Pelobium sp.]